MGTMAAQPIQDLAPRQRQDRTIFLHVKFTQLGRAAADRELARV
jgi:hypothetical protein